MRSLSILSAFFVCFFISLSVCAQSSAELKKRKEKLNKEIEMLNKSLKQTAGSKKLSLKQVNALMGQIRLREEKIGTINAEVRLLDKQIKDNTKTVDHLQSDLGRLKNKYAEMIRFAAKNQNSYTTLMFLFSSGSFNQAYMRMKYLSQFSRFRIKQAAEIKRTQKQITIKIGELDKDKNEKNNLLSDEVQEKQQLGKQKDRTSKELQKFTAKERQLSQQLDTRQKEASRLNAEIRAAIRREIIAETKRLEAIAAAKAKAQAKAEADRVAAAKKANPDAVAVKKTVIAAPKPVSKGSDVLAASPEGAKLSAGFINNRGRLPWPVAKGRISESFGTHTYGVDVRVVNTGIDIETTAGASALAVFDGEVFSVHNFGGFYAVMIRHGEYITIYSNLRSSGVSKGQKVNNGQAIGTVMADQYDNKTKLHFEVRKGVSELNPALWLAQR